MAFSLNIATIKKRGLADPLEPKAFLSSKAHPDYQSEEWNYFLEHYARISLRKGRFSRATGLPLNDPKVLAYLYNQEFEGLNIDSDEKDKYVVAGFQLFSKHVVYLFESFSPARLCDEANRLGGNVCRILGSLVNQSESGDYSARQQAKKRLAKIIKAVSPDARGKRKIVADPFGVQRFYWMELFCLYHIHNALKSSVKNRSQKLKAISADFEIPIDRIRELWNLDDEDQPTARPVSLKEMARILTAQRFKITQHRVSNIIAS